MRSASGRVHFYGKAAALGLKCNRQPALKISELIVSKTTTIAHIAIGHDGIHAVLLGEDGSAFFAGTARRGEDGDSSKNRRQPKAVKPKRLTKLDGHWVVHAACNNGTSAFVTKSGKLVMYGKDTAHCDGGGYVTGLAEHPIARVALGKAHCVALGTKGQVFTFGLNNKGQCGRQAKGGGGALTVGGGGGGGTSGEASTSVSPKRSATSASVEPANGVAVGGDVEAAADVTTTAFGCCQLCDADEHSIEQGQCRVCPFCRECTGYNTSCVVSQMIERQQRVPGANCACGRGEAGCAKCGACATCIAVQENEAGGYATGEFF